MTYQNSSQLKHTLFFASNTQNKYTGPMKKHIYKCILLFLPSAQEVILILFGWNYILKTLHFLLILKWRLVVSINTLFSCYKPLLVTTFYIEISMAKYRVLIKERRNSVTIVIIKFVRVELNRVIHKELIGTKFIKIGKG